MNGDVESEGRGVLAADSGKVEVNGDVKSKRSGASSRDQGSSVTVNGNVTSGEGEMR